MSILARFRTDFKFVHDGTPGRRFRDFQRYKDSNRDTLATRVIMIAVAMLLIVVGLAIGWLPGPGGFLSILGLAILAPYVPGIPYCMDKSEILIRRIFVHIRSFWKSTDRESQ